jgi:hypothetical protein
MEDQDFAGPEAWGATIAGLINEMNSAVSGLERRKLEAQIKDAEEGRRNAMNIARLQSQTSRYGTDKQFEATMAGLKQRAHEFEQTHALELKKFGLNYAQVATEYLSTPDRYFQAGDFMNMAGRVFANQPGVAPLGATGTPTPKNEPDFAVLANGGNPLNPGSAPGPTQTGTAPRPAAAPGPTAAAAGASAAPASAPVSAQGSGAGTDERVKAMTAVLKATPPSGVQGLNDTDYSVLQAIKHIAELPQRPGVLANMRPGQQKMLTSGLSRLGYYAPDWWEDQKRTLPGQGNVRAAG